MAWTVVIGLPLLLLIRRGTGKATPAAAGE